MIDGFVAVIGHQILLTDIGDIARLTIFGEKMVEWLIAIRANILRNGIVPFLRIGEHRIDIEDYATKTEQAMLNDIADAETSVGDRRSIARRAGAEGSRVVHIVYVGSLLGHTRKMAKAALGKALFIR